MLQLGEFMQPQTSGTKELSSIWEGGPAGRLHPSRPLKRIRPPSFSPANLWGAGKELLRYRDLLITLSLHRLKVRYKQSVLGWAWAILQPLSLMLIYTVLFSVVTKISTEGVPYALFVYSALLPWTYFATIITTAAGCLVLHSHLITKVYFPREILPLTYVTAAFFDFLIAAALMGGMLVYYRVSLDRNVLYLIPDLVLITMLGIALALVLSALQVRTRDIGLAMPLVMQLWMFATPVVYPLSAVPVRFRALYTLNPMAGAIENFRRVLIQRQPPDFASLYVTAAISIIAFPLAYLFFKRKESLMADII